MAGCSGEPVPLRESPNSFVIPRNLQIHKYGRSQRGQKRQASRSAKVSRRSRFNQLLQVQYLGAVGNTRPGHSLQQMLGCANANL